MDRPGKVARFAAVPCLDRRELVLERRCRGPKSATRHGTGRTMNHHPGALPGRLSASLPRAQRRPPLSKVRVPMSALAPFAPTTASRTWNHPAKVALLASFRTPSTSCCMVHIQMMFRLSSRGLALVGNSRHLRARGTRDCQRPHRFAAHITTSNAPSVTLEFPGPARMSAQSQSAAVRPRIQGGPRPISAAVAGALTCISCTPDKLRERGQHRSHPSGTILLVLTFSVICCPSTPLTMGAGSRPPTQPSLPPLPMLCPRLEPSSRSYSCESRGMSYVVGGGRRGRDSIGDADIKRCGHAWSQGPPRGRIDTPGFEAVLDGVVFYESIRL